jgi:hypothetical protein
MENMHRLHYIIISVRMCAMSCVRQSRAVTFLCESQRCARAFRANAPAGTVLSIGLGAPQPPPRIMKVRITINVLRIRGVSGILSCMSDSRCCIASCDRYENYLRLSSMVMHSWQCASSWERRRFDKGTRFRTTLTCTPQLGWTVKLSMDAITT